MANSSPWATYLTALYFLSVWCLISVRGCEPSAAHAGDVAIKIIVHPSVPAQALTRGDLEAIFKRQERLWRGDGTVIPFNQEWSSPLRRTFDSAVLGLDGPGAQKYWIDTLVRGGPQPPRTVSSSGLVPQLVARLPGAIGYVDESLDTEGTRVVARIRGGMVVAP